MLSGMINFEDELNDEQLAAVTAPDGPALVLAGAGSGKTRTLTHRVAYLILKRGVDPREILLLTFTNKAAREMLERVLDLAPSRYPPSWAGTFHSIGGRILRSHGEKVGLAPNYTILDTGDSESLFNTTVKELDKDFSKNKDNPKAKVLLNTISYARNTQQPLHALIKDRYPWFNALPEKVDLFAERYEAKKREMQVVDYDDLLTLWLKLLKEHEDVRLLYQNKFKHILVDEYQDTNTIQSEIIDLIGAHHNIMAVGDDAQCIYTWRGANFENIHAFPDRHPGTTIYKIVRNYRSTPEILNFANSVLRAQPASAGYEKELIADRPSSMLPYVVPAMDSRQQAQFLINRIQGLYDEGLKLSDIAILYRAHYQALDTQLEFSRKGIPFVITSGLKFFEQAHVRDFVAQLRFVSNPNDLQALERILCLLPKVGPATVRKILRLANKHVAAAQKENARNTDGLFKTAQADERLVHALSKADTISAAPADAREDLEQLVISLKELDNLIRTNNDEHNQITHSPAQIIEHAVDGWYCDFIRNVYTDWERRQEDLESLVGFAQRYETIAELLAQLVLLNAETSNNSTDLSDDTAVRMTTIHQAKGLEYKVVFIIGCADDLFPLKRAIEEGDLEEERRLFYVAVTRAKDELYLCYPIINNGRGGAIRLNPSRFLQEIPSSHYEKLGFRPQRW